MKHKALLKLLQSGNFSVFYWDNLQCEVYKGKHDLDTIAHDVKPVAVFDYSNFEGYLPEIVNVLVQALGGTAESI